MKMFENKQSKLLEAIREGHPDKVIRYLQKGADVNAKEKDGWTPLHSAAEKGHKEVIELLIAKGADVHARNKEGKIPQNCARYNVGDLLFAKTWPLHMAAREGQKDIAEQLIFQGADINAKDPVTFKTPLHFAVISDHMDMAELLIAKGADVNADDFKAGTPLHYATANGHIEMVELLIAKGADVNAYKVGFYKTPLYNAARGGHRDVAALLKKHGAVGYYRILDGILIIFKEDFEPKGIFIDSILEKMKVHGSTYKEWMTGKTPFRILVNPDAQNPITILANAAVQFRTMGITFSMENVEHATFEGTYGIKGAVVTHWTSTMGKETPKDDKYSAKTPSRN